MSVLATLSVRRVFSSGGQRSHMLSSFRQRGRPFGRREIPMASRLHACADRLSLRDREQDEKTRLSALPTISALSTASYHSSAATERAAVTMLGLGATSAASHSASRAVRACKEWQATLPEEPPAEEVKDDGKEEQNQSRNEANEEAKNEKPEGKRENVFAAWFGVDVGSNYYEGGFEETRKRPARV